MLTNFRYDLPSYADPHMSGANVGTLLGAVGLYLDTMSEQVTWGRLQSGVWAGGLDALRTGAARLTDGRLIECDPWVLPLHAEQRGVRLYPTEPTLARRVRISLSMPYKRERGSHRGLLKNVLWPYFVGGVSIPRMRIVHRTGGAKDAWYTLEDTDYKGPVIGPNNWNFGGAGRSRFWVAIYTTDVAGVEASCFRPLVDYDDPLVDYDDPLVDYDVLSSDTAKDLVQMCRDHAAHSKLAGVMIVHDIDSLSTSNVPFTSIDGWTTHPVAGNWISPVYTSGPKTGLATRDPTVTFLHEDP